MNNNSEYANRSIECSVTSCANHCCNDHYCALEKIKVGAHGKERTHPESTDCRSFVSK